MSPVLLGGAAAFGAAAAWALATVLFKQTTNTVAPLGLTFIKGGVAVVPLAIVVGAGSYSLPLNSVAILALSGVIGIGLGDTLFFAALRALPAHLVILLGLSGQALTVIGAVLLLGELPSLQQWMGIGLVFTGLVIACLEVSRGGVAQPQGLLFGLGAVLAMTAGTLLAKVGLESVSALPATFLRLLAGTVTVFILGLTTGRLRTWLSSASDPTVLRPLLVATLIGTLGGVWLFHVALEHADVSLVNTIAATEPLVALPLAAIYLGDRIELRTIVGSLIALAGVCLLLLT